MKKRVFIPLSISFLLLDLFFWALGLFLAVGFFLIIFNVVKVSHPEYCIIMPIAIIFLLFHAVRYLICFKISLRQEYIITCGDGLPKFEKIQYKCSIKYSEIKSVSIVASEKDSRNKKIRLKWLSSSMPKKYLEFILKNDTKERMCINYYTKKQTIKLLNYLNQNMKYSNNENTLNIQEVMKDWYSYGNYNREDLKIKRGETVKKKKSR